MAGWGFRARATALVSDTLLCCSARLIPCFSPCWRVLLLVRLRLGRFSWAARQLCCGGCGHRASVRLPTLLAWCILSVACTLPTLRRLQLPSCFYIIGTLAPPLLLLCFACILLSRHVLLTLDVWLLCWLRLLLLLLLCKLAGRA